MTAGKLNTEGHLSKLILDLENASFDCGAWDDEHGLGAWDDRWDCDGNIPYQAVVDVQRAAKKTLIDYIHHGRMDTEKQLAVARYTREVEVKNLYQRIQVLEAALGHADDLLVKLNIDRNELTEASEVRRIIQVALMKPETSEAE